MFYFGRDSKIIDNTDSNVYLCDNNTITISWNQLKSGAHIGVTLENLPEEGAYTVIATSANNGYVEDAITSDNADYTILRSDDEVIIYSKTTKLHTHPVCGKTCDHDVAHASVVWKGVSSLDEITTSGYYYLTQNIELTKTWSPVPGVKLCLNGHNITANADVDVITMPDVGSFMIFTLTDCMGENGTTYGKITHAEGKTGHGIYVKNRVVMYGGEISGNTVGTYKNGGGVYVYDFCEFEMHGGSITGNSANYGGGVYFRDISEFTMDGGSITDNSASRGGGVYLSQGSFTVSGKAKITNNTLSDKTTANNVGGWGYIIKVDTPGLDSTASIGVTTSDIAEGSYVVVAEGIEAYKKSYQLKEKDLKCFSSDVADYTPKLINNNIVFTNGDVHEHAICGEKDCEDGHDAALWIPLTYDAASHDLKYGTSTVTKTEGTYNGSKYYTYTLPAGNYYLKEDIALPGSIRINGDVNICLNGKTISAKGDGDALFFLVKNKLTVCDCLDGGKISVTDSRDAVYLWTGNGGKASFNLYGGTITESRYGVSGLGTVGLYGGTITGNNYGEALSSGSSLTIGGDVKIIGNTKRNVYLDFGQTITIDHSLTQNARIGVITYSQPSADTKVQIATGADADLDYTQIFTSDVTDKNYVVTKDEKGDLYLGIHQHHWVCSAEGATIKIECDADNCKLGDDFAATYTVMAPAGDDLIYSGSEKPASVTVSGDATGVTLPEVPGITYQKESGNGYEALDEAPKDAGTYKASIALNGVTASVTYTIVSKKVTDPTIEVTETYTYDGIAKKPSVVVKDGDKVIDKGEYEVSYENNTNAGDAAIVKIADAAGGNYDVSGSTLFSIGKAIITVTPEEGQKKIYGETESLVLEYSSSGAVTGETPAFIGALSRAEGKDAGNYAITLGTLALKDNSAGNFMAANYELKLADTQVQFTIEPKTLTAADLEFTDSTITKIYDGNTDCTTATVQIKDSAKAYPDDAMPKVTGTYAYNSANVTEAKEVTFTSEAVRNNNYILPSGLKLTHAASITKADQAPLTIISTSATYGTDLALTVSGGTGAGKVAYTVVNGTGEATVSEDVLHPEKVGEVTVVATKSGGDNYNDVISAATVITIKKGVYSGTVSKTVNIIKNRNTVQTGTLTAADFFPEGQKPDGVKISNVNGILDGAVMRHWSLNADTGEISYTSEVNITSVTDQTCTVIITSTNYNDITATLTFQLTDKQTVTISGLTYEDRSYDGSAMKPAGTLAVSDNKVPVNDLEVRYEGTNGTIYDSAKAPVDSGTYKVTYKVADSNDDYIGSVEYTFTISPKTVTEDMIGAIDAQEYTGKAMKPEPTVKNGELTMISGKDFTFSYADNTNAGEATVTITGKGNYTGTVSRTFTIKPKNISDASIELDHDSLVYTGQPQEVQIKSVTLDGVTLKEADYDIANGSNKHSSVDDITLTIEGKGNYTGTATKIWKITKADPTRENFDVTPDLTTAQTYDGMPKWVNVEVKSGVRGMGKVTVYYEGISDTDYARSQTAPVNAGEYKVIAVVTDDGTNYNAKEIEIGTLTINKAAVPELEDITRYYAFTQTGEQTIDIGNLVPGTYGYDFSYVEGSDTGILSEHVIIDAADDLIKFTLSELTEENVGNKVTVRVTISSDNYEDATFNVIICIAPDYKIIEGANSTWKKNSKNDLVIRGNGEFAKFRDVKVDGEILESENYTAEAGSTVITLKASYLKTLSKGSHSFEILWEDGSAGTDFKIAANSSGSSHSNNNNNSTADTTGSTAAPASVTSPKTGDDLDIWLILFAISLAGTVGLLARRKKFKNI